MAGKVAVTKLVFANLADPAKVRALMDEKTDEQVIGTVIGLVTAGHHIKRKGPDGMTDVEYHGLKGTFEGIPADPERDTYISGICFMPEAFQGPILAVVDAEGFDVTKPVRFAAEVIVAKANNPQKYTWRLRPMGEVAQYDALAELRTMALPKPAEQEKPPVDAGGEKAKAKAK